MTLEAMPSSVTWDVTYSCQLRCTYCYSESGRRPARGLSREDMLRVADALVRIAPRSVQISGGEPLLVPDLLDVARRLVEGGVPVALFTHGIDVTDANAPELARLFFRIFVSVDGAGAAVHDPIRGRIGAFEGALRGLAALDRTSAEQRRRGGERFRFGIDCNVVQSNFDDIPALCAEVAPRFPELSFLRFAAAVPAGLASRESYAEHELLTEEQLAVLRDPAFAARLRELAPRSVEHVVTSDNFLLAMRPEDVERGTALVGVMHVEADGRVRGMPTYEGTVGSLLTEPPDVLWRRARERREHPVVREALSSVRTMKEWAAATRRIDACFAAPEDLARIGQRREHVPGGPISQGPLSRRSYTTTS